MSEDSAPMKESSYSSIKTQDFLKNEEQMPQKEKKSTIYQGNEINTDKNRYPYCIVWTPLPLITWILPCIGHIGICTGEGIIHDFAGPYYVSIDDMAFGNPTKYVQLNLTEKEKKRYDLCIDNGTRDYTRQNYSFCCNNCHSFVAHCLNLLKYKDYGNYNMVSVWWMITLKGKYISTGKFLQSYCGFFIFVLFILFIRYLIMK